MTLRMASESDSKEDDAGESSNSVLTPPLLTLIAGFTGVQWGRAAIYYLVDFSGPAPDPFLFINSDLGFDPAAYG